MTNALDVTDESEDAAFLFFLGDKLSVDVIQFVTNSEVSFFNDIANALTVTCGMAGEACRLRVPLVDEKRIDDVIERALSTTISCSETLRSVGGVSRIVLYLQFAQNSYRLKPFVLVSALAGRLALADLHLIIRSCD